MHVFDPGKCNAYFLVFLFGFTKEMEHLESALPITTWLLKIIVKGDLLMLSEMICWSKFR